MQPLNLHEEFKEVTADEALPYQSSLNYKTFLAILLSNHGTFMKGLKFYLDYPFVNVFHIHDMFIFPKEALVFFWYLFETHTIAISFNVVKLLLQVYHCEFSKPPAPTKNLFTLLNWFLLGHQWVRRLNICQKTYVLIMFRRPISYLTPTSINQTQP